MIVPGFYWKWEPAVKDKARFYHTSDKCPEGRKIPVIERGYDCAECKHCPICLKLNIRRQ